jgi:tetratricopeptide (TPR) repeat protein/tRNA A-37 threonylcarbamoyl transferase component Bud32
MPNSTPCRPASDRNLLFGILALQMDFIGRDALIAAMNAWVLDKAKPLGTILQAQGALAEDERAALEALVDKHLHKHGGDAERSLAAVDSAGAVGSVCDELRRLADPDLDASLAQIGAAPAAGGPDGVAGTTVDHVGEDDAPLCCPVRYRVLRPHARGGLGEVFVAEDRELHREVAFKEIQKPYAHDAHSRSRFLLEAEVNGRLEHPGVVPVYGLGSYRDGRPFYAMRFIRGVSLKEAIGHFHAADVPGRDPGERGLALRQMLGQFVAVCNAVAYAHSRGVIHRDLNPSNVMLGKFGETLVVDWGLAKVVGRQEGEPAGDEMTLRPSSGDGSATVAGTAVGTPAYMSPEQAAGRPDLVGPASDIYSLGATLYALLTGQAPLRGADQGELLRRTSRGEWVPPRQVKRGVPAALDAVCRKAMALKPQDRYATAQALAADIEHWLADGPVTAYREPLLRRLGRWRRRHPALAAGLLVLLLAAAAAGVWVKLERDAVEQDVRAALREVEQWQEKGQRAEARAALERARGRLAGGGQGELRRRLRQAEADLQMVAELEDIRLRQTEVKDDGFDKKRADPAYAAAFRGYGLEVLAADPGETARRIAASAIREHLIVALDHWTEARPEKDARGRERLLSLARLADKDEWRQRLRDPAVWKGRAALKRLAQERRSLAQPPVTALILAGYLWRAGEQADAVGVVRRAQQRHPGDFWLNYTLAARLRVSEPSRKEEALGFYRAAVAVRPQSAGGHASLGAVLSEQGRYQEAEAACRRALTLKEDFPLAHSNLGAALSEQGRYQEAEAACRRALALKEDFPLAHYNLGDALNRQKRPKEAEAAFRRALALKEDFPEAHSGLGQALNLQGRPKEAEAACRRALALKEEFPLAHYNLGKTLIWNLGNYPIEQGRPAFRRAKEAEAAFRRALALKEDFPEAHASLGQALNLQDRSEEAEAACLRAIALKEDFSEAHFSLGFALNRQGRPEQGRAALRRAIALKEDFSEARDNLGVALSVDTRPKADDRPVAHYNLGNALWRQGKLPEAEAAYRRAIALKEDYPEAHCNLGLALLRQGQFAAAVAPLKRGHELGSKAPGWPHPSARWLQEAERLLVLDRKLPAILKREVQAADAREGLALAQLCVQYKRLYAAAARFYADAFAADPKLADDPRVGHRYDAARSAALAAAGKGEDASKLDGGGRAWLRGQALAWLRALLRIAAAWVEKGTLQQRAAMAKGLRHWQADPDLAGVRDAAALAGLPQVERADWQRLWADVQAVLEKAGGKATKGK